MFSSAETAAIDAGGARSATGARRPRWRRFQQRGNRSINRALGLFWPMERHCFPDRIEGAAGRMQAEIMIWLTKSGAVSFNPSL